MITSFTARQIQLRERKQIPEQDAPFVGGLLLNGAQPPAPHDVLAVEGADGYVRIADIESKQHRLDGPHATRQYCRHRSIIFAHPQESRRIQSAGDALDACFCAHPLSKT